MFPCLLYTSELTKEPIAIEWTTKQAQASSDDIGTYRALLARVIELHQEEITSELSPEEASFWGVAVRVLRKKLAAEGIQIPQISTELKSRQLQSDTLQALYPEAVSYTHLRHEELLATNAIYQEVYEMQTQGKGEADEN